MTAKEDPTCQRDSTHAHGLCLSITKKEKGVFPRQYDLIFILYYDKSPR